jgi:hypothetical protein
MLQRFARTADKKVATIDGSRVNVQTSVALGKTMMHIPITDTCTFSNQPVEIHATETMFVMRDTKGQVHIADSTLVAQEQVQDPSDVMYSRTYQMTSDDDTRTADDINTIPRLIWQKPLEYIKLVACGINHVLAVSEGNTVYARGCNANGQLGIGKTPTTVRVFGNTVGGVGSLARVERRIFFPDFERCDFEMDDADNIWQVGAGNAHSAILTAGGDVWVCGEARACGRQSASNPTARLDIYSFAHLNKFNYVERYRQCSCLKCTRYNTTRLAEMVANNDTASRVTEMYGFAACDSLAVGRDFTAVKFVGTNQIFSTDAWNPTLKSIAMRDKLKLGVMLLATKCEFVCSYDTPGDNQESQQHCISIFANAHSKTLYASVVNVNNSNSVRMYNLLDKIKIINVNPEMMNTRMHVRVDAVHSCWPEVGGMYVADFFNSVYYIHEQLTQTIKTHLPDAPQLEEHLLISPDHQVAWAMTQHKRLGNESVAHLLTPDVHKLIYKAWFAMCVPRVLGPQTVQTVRFLLRDQELDSLDIPHARERS